MKKKDDNFLDLIPEKNCRWEQAESGKIFLLVPRFKNQWLKKIARKLGKSELVKVHFDEIGSNTWRLIDGASTVEQIGQQLEKEMQDKVQPVYQRLSEFLSILSRNKFIYFKNF